MTPRSTSVASAVCSRHCFSNNTRESSCNRSELRDDPNDCSKNVANKKGEGKKGGGEERRARGDAGEGVEREEREKGESKKGM